jgi:hypothetical protein
MIRLLVATVLPGHLLLAAATAEAKAGLDLDPETACGLLADHQLRTRGFRASGEEFACRSRRRPLVGAGQPSHTLRFRALGTAVAVGRLLLELQINSSTALQRAHRQLADHARVLFERVFDKDLPQEIEAAILAAVPGEWRVDRNRVRLDRITAGTPHYTLRLSIE